MALPMPARYIAAMAGFHSFTRTAVRALVAAMIALSAFEAAPAIAQEGANAAGFWIQERERYRPPRPVAAPPRQAIRVRRLVPNRRLAKPTIWTNEEKIEIGDRLIPDASAATQNAYNMPPTLAPDFTTVPPVAAVVAAVQPPANVAALPPADVAAPLPGAADPIRKDVSFVALVAGDSLGQMLGQGLADAFADSSIGVVRKGKESSGLVRDDYFDWPKNLRESLNGSQRIDVLVMMIGSNDRQALRDAAGSYEPLTPRWRELYGERIDAVLTIARDRKVPVVWVGMPIMKGERYSTEIAELNEMVRARVDKSGGRYVDVWEGFADDRGRYNVFGPDLNGQIVKLRTTDGVHFTKPGARKLAHFVEGPVRRLFDTTRPASAPAVAALPSAVSPAVPAPEVMPAAPAPVIAAVPQRPAIGPIVPLTAPPLAANGELARGRPQGAGAQEAQALIDRTFVEGRAIAPRPGRADDFSWPRK